LRANFNPRKRWQTAINTVRATNRLGAYAKKSFTPLKDGRTTSDEESSDEDPSQGEPSAGAQSSAHLTPPSDNEGSPVQELSPSLAPTKVEHATHPPAWEDDELRTHTMPGSFSF